jgi:hypothetical protein
MARAFYVSATMLTIAAIVTAAAAFELDATMIGSAGVSLLLAAFLLNAAGWLSTATPAYLTLNLLGAALACLSSYMIDFLPFVLLEGAWAAVAMAGLARAAIASPPRFIPQ